MKRKNLLLSALMAVSTFALTTEVYGQTQVQAKQSLALSKLVAGKSKEQQTASTETAESKQNNPPPQSPAGNTPPPAASSGNTTPPTPVSRGTIKTVTLTNQSTQPVGSIAISFSGTNAGDFSQTNDCGSSLAGGGSCTISVIFLPKTSGPKSATMEVTSTGGGQAVYLTGTGT